MINSLLDSLVFLFLENVKQNATGGEPSIEIQEKKELALSDFEKAMDSDLDTTAALAVLHRFVNEVNKLKLSPGDYGEVVATLQRLDAVFGFFNFNIVQRDIFNFFLRKTLNHNSRF